MSLTEKLNRIANTCESVLPKSIVNSSGRLLYSPGYTIEGNSPIYFLGFNPGETAGRQELHDTLTVEWDINRLRRNEIVENGYLDERWKGHLPGMAPIQRAGQSLFTTIANGDSQKGRSLLCETPIGNFIFSRSPTAQVLESRTGMSGVQLAMACWPVHQQIMKQAGTKVLLTHAVTLARPLARAMGLGEGEQMSSGWGGTLSTLYAWELSSGIRMLAIPNLSRYKPDGPRIPALKSFFERFGPQL